MNRNDDILRRMLDNELTPQEQDAASRAIAGDHDLKQEFDDLAAILAVLKRDGRREPGQAFTARVMEQLPRRAPSLRLRLRNFLFGSRVLRWNVASAAAVASVLIATAAVLWIGGGAKPGGNATVLVQLRLSAPQASQVAVAGSFNNWRPDVHVMTRRNGDWIIELPLKPGVYTYMFVVNGQSWVPDPLAESYQPDGFGSRNAVLKVAI